MTDYGEKNEIKPNFKPIKDENEPAVAVALKDNKNSDNRVNPTILAAARGALAEQIIQLAFENDIKVREDGDLAHILAEMELDSPVPTEALMAVAEILSYVYRANGEVDPFNAILPPQDEQEDL